MPRHKIITLTGLDRTGKETQSRLLEQALKPSELMTSPDYKHWSGQIIRAILYEEEFQLSRGTTETGAYSGTFSQHKDAIVIQALHLANRMARMNQIREGLEHHHWIMDRYDIDALAFGLIDGCPKEWLYANQALYQPSDLSLVFLGKGYDRPGLALDINEVNKDYLKSVEKVYRELAEVDPTIRIVEIDNINPGNSRLDSVYNVHCHVAETIRRALPEVSVKTLTKETIAGITTVPGNLTLSEVTSA